jgi:hypothetical protein
MKVLGTFAVSIFLLAAGQNALAFKGQCVQEGDYYSLKNGAGVDIGQPGTYSLESCKKSLQKTAGDLICGFWTGTGAWRPFNTSTMQFIPTDYGFGEQETCLEDIVKSRNNVVCGGNGSFYTVYNIRTGQVIGDKHGGFADIESCEHSVLDSKFGLVCNYQPGKDAFRVYSVKDSSVYQEGVFSKYAGCAAFLNILEKPPGPSLAKKTPAEIFTPFKTKMDEGGFGFAYKDCSEPRRRYHIVKTDAHEKLLPACMPDTFYSWGDYEKLRWYVDNMGEGPWTGKFSRPLYTTLSPAGTFGYGSIPVRIKIKPDTKIIFSDERNLAYGQNLSCDKISNADQKNSIIVRYFESGRDSGIDYIFCSPGPIASWSYGTQEHYDEVINEYLWAKGHGFKDYELYYKRGGVDLFIDSAIDGLDFSANKFFFNMKEFYRLASENHGHIYYNKNVIKDRAEHFRTSKPSYFNPRKEQ